MPVPACVGRAAVDTEPDPYAQLEHFRHPGSARSQAHIGSRTVAYPRIGLPKLPKFGIREVDAMRKPHVPAEPTAPLHKPQRPHAISFHAIGRLVLGFGKMRVKQHFTL